MQNLSVYMEQMWSSGLPRHKAKRLVLQYINGVSSNPVEGRTKIYIFILLYLYYTCEQFTSGWQEILKGLQNRHVNLIMIHVHFCRNGDIRCQSLGS